MARKGLFVTFEGIDGCGKTTQLGLSEKYLKKKGCRVTVLREPGSTPVSEKIRKILLDKRLAINPISELNLYIAARAELVREIIRPALRRSEVVLCDRFYDSTVAYQGYGRGIDIRQIKRLNLLAVGDTRPDLTFLVDIDYKTSLLRRKKGEDRLESESRAFFNRVRKGFLEIARKEKRRIHVLDGRNSVEEIFEEVKRWLHRRLRVQ